jgi:hypothetical protein
MVVFCEHGHERLCIIRVGNFVIDWILLKNYFTVPFVVSMTRSNTFLNLLALSLSMVVQWTVLTLGRFSLKIPCLKLVPGNWTFWTVRYLHRCLQVNSWRIFKLDIKISSVYDFYYLFFTDHSIIRRYFVLVTASLKTLGSVSELRTVVYICSLPHGMSWYGFSLRKQAMLNTGDHSTLQQILQLPSYGSVLVMPANQSLVLSTTGQGKILCRVSVAPLINVGSLITYIDLLNHDVTLVTPWVTSNYNISIAHGRL